MIVPLRKIRELQLERIHAKRYLNSARTLVLETQNKSLNDRDTSVLANGAEAGCGPLAFTPVLERVTPELLAFVADDIFRCAASVDDSAFEEGLNG